MNVNSKKVVVELYDATDCDFTQIDDNLRRSNLEETLEQEDDEDKVLYNFIGKASLSIDEVIKQIIVTNG